MLVMWFAWTYIWMGGREPVLSFLWAAAISSFFFFSSFCCCSFFFCKSLTFCASFCISFYNWESLQHHYWPTHTACYSYNKLQSKREVHNGRLTSSLPFLSDSSLRRFWSWSCCCLILSTCISKSEILKHNIKVNTYSVP